MFQLSVIKDTVAVHPSQFGLPPEQAITNELNKVYANRVLHDVGLCICVFDLAEVGEGKVRYGDGCLWYKVIFRLCVFRPFGSEVILAKVKSSDEDGVRLTVGFFDDIYVPLVYLPEPCAFDPKERAHFWLPGSEVTSSHELLDSPLTDRMYIDAGMSSECASRETSSMTMSLDHRRRMRVFNRLARCDGPRIPSP
ncbi:RNA polymerase Rpb7 [Epithele typhae]|uniref:RNA polymerase Rpb7 n=1 Tax=Epithele typhae TaxID=378194 RepID=UPI0020079CE7|nr:RNA polymerase Rpb7 [Epithele typhae]KAH9939116.1 RNA polymerase Rpb7 [Epithele typhae]